MRCVVTIVSFTLCLVVGVRIIFGDVRGYLACAMGAMNLALVNQKNNMFMSAHTGPVRRALSQDVGLAKSSKASSGYETQMKILPPSICLSQVHSQMCILDAICLLSTHVGVVC